MTVLVSPAEGGYVVGDGTYAAGETIELVAVPYAESVFVRWTEGEETVSTDPRLAFSADRHRVLTAHFASRAGFFGFNGRWVGGIHILPEFSLGPQRFEVGLDQPPGGRGWRIRLFTTISEMGDWTGLQLSASGPLGDIRTSTGLTFDPAIGEYRSSFAALQWTGQGMTIGCRVNHTTTGGSPPGPRLLYTWTLRSDDLSVAARLEEPCGQGLLFRDVQVQFTNLLTCCGIATRTTVLVSESGLDFVRFSANGIPVPDTGLRLDLSFQYSLDTKEVSVTPRWDAICSPCFTIYGDLEHGRANVYGLKLLCCLSELLDPDCSDCVKDECPPGSRVRAPYLEYGAALDPSKVPVQFKGEENSYLKSGFCGEGCCGGALDIELTAFFAPTESLFGLTRILAYVAWPWSESLRWELDAEFSFVGGETTFKMAWDYRF